MTYNKEKIDLKWINVKVYSTHRCIGKTTVAMTIIKYLRSIGYKDVRYKGHSYNHSRMVEEQINRTINEDPFVQDVVIFVEDFE